MSIDTGKFPIPFLKALDNWQAGGKNKEKKAAHLRRHSAHLGDAYRSCFPLAYRQFRVNARVAFPMATEQRFVEKVSSWTTCQEVAKHFREAEFDRAKVLMIFARRPSPNDVTLNLNDIYADPDFGETVAHYQESHAFKFIRRYAGTQKEIVLDEIEMRNDEVALIGAYRKLEDVVPSIGEPLEDAKSDAEILKELTRVGPDEIFWAPRSSAEFALNRYVTHAMEFIETLSDKKIWSGMKEQQGEIWLSQTEWRSFSYGSL